MDGATVWRDMIIPAASALAAAVLSQIREFYGPIYSMLKARGAIFRSWNENGPLQVVNDEVRKLFVRQNDAIERLILDKAHLIELKNGKIPEVIEHLGAHVFVWNACIQQFGEVPPHVKATVKEATWPEGFEKYIERTIIELKSELDRLTGFSRQDRTGPVAAKPDRTLGAAVGNQVIEGAGGGEREFHRSEPHAGIA